jgi:hypothetical protein
MTTTVHEPALVNGASLLDRALFARLSARIHAEHPDLPAGMPERILDQALAFLGACAVATAPIGPSDLVDIGWHTFILYTREYAQFCDQLAGRFIHHVPDDDPPGGDRPIPGRPGDGSPVPPAIAAVGLSATLTAIRAAGYRIDLDLWPAAADCSSKCSQCHQGCHNSPR